MNISMPIQMDSPVDRTTFYKWSQIVEYLEDRFGKVTIAAWVENAMITEFTEDVLRIEVGSDFECEILKRRCLEHIQNALKELFDSNATVEIYADGNWISYHLAAIHVPWTKQVLPDSVAPVFFWFGIWSELSFPFLSDSVFALNHPVNARFVSLVDSKAISFSGETIDNAVHTGAYFGLFANAEGDIFNLTLSNVNIQIYASECVVNSSSSFGVSVYVGGLAGRSNGEIANCTVSGTITATGNTDVVSATVGGLVGITSTNCSIHNSYNEATVKAVSL